MRVTVPSARTGQPYLLRRGHHVLVAAPTTPGVPSGRGVRVGARTGFVVRSVGGMATNIVIPIAG